MLRTSGVSLEDLWRSLNRSHLTSTGFLERPERLGVRVDRAGSDWLLGCGGPEEPYVDQLAPSNATRAAILVPIWSIDASPPGCGQSDNGCRGTSRGSLSRGRGPE